MPDAPNLRLHQPSGPLARLRRLLAHHRDGVLSIVLVALAFCWMVGYAKWELFGRETFGAFYDAQARSLLQGRWDVPHEPDVIHTEGFLRDGKWYGYFGFFPALLRVPLVLIAPGMDGRWSRVSVVVALTLGCAYAYALLPLARRAFDLPEAAGRTARSAYPLFVIAAGLGSTSIFLASRTFPYHEALAWGSTLALASFYHLMRFTTRPDRWGHLLAAGALAYASFFSRATVGAGALAGMALLAVNVVSWRLAAGARAGPAGRLLAPARALCGWSPDGPPPPRRAAAFAAGVVAAAVLTFVGVNHAKFGTTLDAAPLWRHEDTMNTPGRLARTGGKLVTIANVRTIAYNVFAPNRIAFRPTFPWVFTTQTLKVFPEARLDYPERYASIPATMPLLSALAVAGLLSIRRRRLAPAPPGDGSKSDGGPGEIAPRANDRATPIIPIIAALAGGLAVLAAQVTHRYLHDFFPFLVLAGAFGLHALLGLRSRTARALVPAAAVLALLFSVYVNCALAITYQRAQVWGVPRDRRIAFWHIRYTMDKHVTRLFRPDIVLPSAP